MISTHHPRKVQTIALSCATIAAALFLSSCIPGASPDVSALEAKVDTLQKEVDALRSLGGDSESSPVASGTMEDLTRRVSEIEAARGQTQAALSQQIQDQNTKLARMFNDFNDMHEMVVTGQTWAAFGVGYQGHVVARTPHGAFLVELINHEQVQDGYRLKLRIGNPTGLDVSQFRIFGDFGSPPPDHSEAADYAAYIDSVQRWEGSLKQFDATFVTPLEPNRWTEVGLTIPKSKLSDLQFIRFRMSVTKARLEKSAYDDSFVVMGVDGPHAQLFKTPYGSFPVNLRDERPIAGGYQADFYLANPFAMTITNSRMTIRYGKARPVNDGSLSPEEYQQQLVEWSNSLRVMEQGSTDQVLPFHWNLFRVTFPTQNREDIGYMECRWEILSILLRDPQQAP